MDDQAREAQAMEVFGRIVDQIAEDPAFRELIKADPQRAMIESGFAAELADHGEDDEVAGFAKEELLEFPGIRILGAFRPVGPVRVQRPRGR